MKRLAAIFLAVFLQGLLLLAPAQVDSTALKALDMRLDEYFRTMETESSAFKGEECDTLIASAGSEELRRHIALKAYYHYVDSKLMGDETVAVHLADRWLLSGEIAVDEADLFSARLYTELNRATLIGCKAPSLALRTPDGGEYSLNLASDRRSVICFYDTQCSRCKLETLVLKSLMEDMDYPVTIFAIYTGDNEEEWRSWMDTRFSYSASSVKVVNLWDPYDESGFASKYGVMQTPKMFLVDRDGTILGRGLDTDALRQLLDALISAEYYEYGSDESNALMDRVFEACGPELAPSDVLETATLIAQKTLDLGDTLNFKHLCGDLLYYLSNRRGEAFKEGTVPFLNEYVLGRPDIWSSSDDSLRVVGMASLMKDLLSRTPVGSRLPKGLVGVRMPKKMASDWKKIYRKGGCILFHTSGCPYCEQEMLAAKALGVRCLDIDVDSLGEVSPELASAFLDTFDLSTLPFIVQVGRRGIVLRRYLTLL